MFDKNIVIKRCWKQAAIVFRRVTWAWAVAWKLWDVLKWREGWNAFVKCWLQIDLYSFSIIKDIFDVSFEFRLSMNSKFCIVVFDWKRFVRRVKTVLNQHHMRVSSWMRVSKKLGRSSSLFEGLMTMILERILVQNVAKSPTTATLKSKNLISSIEFANKILTSFELHRWTVVPSSWLKLKISVNCRREFRLFVHCSLWFVNLLRWCSWFPASCSVQQRF